MNETEYVVFLRAKPYTAAKKVNGEVVRRYWVNHASEREIFMLKEILTDEEKAKKRHAKTILISTRVDNITILSKEA